MNEDKENIIVSKTCSFALQVIETYKHLTEAKKEFILSKQLLRSGTSIGANVPEAISSESKKDFIHKLSIALKEARETCYWLRLLTDSHYLSKQYSAELSFRCAAIVRIRNSITLTTKQRYFQNTPDS